MRRDTALKITKYSYAILTILLCSGTVLVFTLSVLTDRFEPGWMWMVSYFSAAFSAEIRTLFQSGTTGLWEIVVIGTPCILVLVKVFSVAFLLKKTLTEPKIAYCVIVLLLVFVDLLVYFGLLFLDPQMRFICIGCVLCRAFLITSGILLISGIKKNE